MFMKPMPRLRAAILALIATTLAVFATSATAQGYPSKPIRIIVPFTAGSATDIMARTIGEKLTAEWGQPVIVENRPGAGGTIGAAQVAKAPPDGYTLLVVATGHVVNPVLYDNIPYDTIGDFTGVIPLATLPSVLVVAAGSPIKSVADLIATAKAKPGQLNYASAGIGSATHVNSEKFRATTGINVVHIPFKGTPETIAETIAGRVDFMFTPILASLPSIKDGRMRALAVSTAKRSPILNDIPTVGEAGVRGFEFNFWVGLLAPVQTPRLIVAQLNQAVGKIMQLPDVRERMTRLGAEPMVMSPAEFDAYLRSEYATLGKIMRDAGAKAN